MYVPGEAAPLPDLPPKGRPPHFDEERSPIGSFRTPEVKAEPTELTAEDALTLLVRITAAGPVLRPPVRPRLEEFPGFKEQFEIENVGEGDGRIDAATWEFIYRLRPRGPEVTAIPSFPYVFFAPGYRPPHLGYQTRLTDTTLLRVKPRTEIKPPSVQVQQQPPRAPEAVYQLVEGPQVLRRDEAAALPGPGVLLVLLLAPPVLCAVWYVSWRRLHPGAARRTRQRRSRAARLALGSLRSLEGEDRPRQGGGAAAIVADYLRQRFDLRALEPTPSEVEAHLKQTGIAAPIVARVGEFLRACDAVRFAPAPSEDGGLLGLAGELILALEAASTEVGPSRELVPASLAVLGILAFAAPAFASEPAWELLTGAEAAFHEGVRLESDSPDEARKSFREAADLYERLREQGYRSADLLHNEGNARLLAGDLPRAILAYRRGLRLAPNNRGLSAGLAHARDSVVHASSDDFGRPPIDHRPPWLPRLAPAWLLGLAVFLYVLGCAGLTRWLMVHRASWLIVAGIALAGCLVVGAVLVIEERLQGHDVRRPLVVIVEDGVLLYRGNGLGYPRYEAPLNAGVEAWLLFSRGDWVQIELAGGEVGWVLRQYALVDSP